MEHETKEPYKTIVQLLLPFLNVAAVFYFLGSALALGAVVLTYAGIALALFVVLRLVLGV